MLNAMVKRMIHRIQTLQLIQLHQTDFNTEKSCLRHNFKDFWTVFNQLCFLITIIKSNTVAIHCNAKLFLWILINKMRVSLASYEPWFGFRNICKTGY